jgi:succinate-semialdehyde dehydrogenase/glutarate-semialdehyde dehydrogenase
MQLRQVLNYIDGKWQSGPTVFNVKNPATEEDLAKVAQSDAADVDAAVGAAKRAFSSWRRTTPFERADVLRKVGSIIDRREDELAEAITLEMGKTLAESRGEVQKLAQVS